MGYAVSPYFKKPKGNNKTRITVNRYYTKTKNLFNKIKEFILHDSSFKRSNLLKNNNHFYYLKVDLASLSICCKMFQT